MKHLHLYHREAIKHIDLTQFSLVATADCIRHKILRCLMPLNSSVFIVVYSFVFLWFFPPIFLFRMFWRVQSGFESVTVLSCSGLSVMNYIALCTCWLYSVALSHFTADFIRTNAITEAERESRKVKQLAVVLRGQLLPWEDRHKKLHSQLQQQLCDISDRTIVQMFQQDHNRFPTKLTKAQTGAH